MSYAKIGDVQLLNNAPASALTEGRRIMADLVARFPDWAEWRRDLAEFDELLATLPPPQ